jgi:hypothetical protein
MLLQMLQEQRKGMVNSEVNGQIFGSGGFNACIPGSANILRGPTAARTGSDNTATSLATLGSGMPRFGSHPSLVTTTFQQDAIFTPNNPLIKAPFPEGEVIFTIPNMGEYRGEVKGGKAKGKGEYSGIDGTWYKGDWDNDLPNGQGEMTLKDGSKYKGGFVDGFPQGKGQKSWANGNSYQGEFHKGRFHGRVSL